MAEWDDFGQKVSLTARIRELIRDYPEGTGILAEQIQNADDASAKVVRFCLDHRVHGTGTQ
jgi:sacsin